MIGGNGRLRRSRRSRFRIYTRSRLGAVRSWSRRRRGRWERAGGHGAFRIQQMIVARPQAQADQRARIGYGLRLPSVIGLIAPHGLFTGLIPGSSRFARHIVFANQRFLDRLRPLGLNLLLAPRRGFSLAALMRGGVLRFAVVRPRDRGRFCVCPCRGMGCGMGLRRRRGCVCGRRGRLRGCAGRRTRSPDQRQSAAGTQPSPHSRATPLLRFQRQPPNLKTHAAPPVKNMD
jgi:hypothetical protein